MFTIRKRLPRALSADLRILVVEDDAIIAEDIIEILRSIGYRQVLHCSNVAVAEQQLTEFRPGLVLLDLNLPQCVGAINLDGLGFAQYLQDQAQLPFVIISGHLSDRRSARLINLSLCRGMIAKPFHPINLQEMMEGSV